MLLWRNFGRVEFLQTCRACWMTLSGIGRRKTATRTQREKWEAFGNVVIHNAIKRQTMETDTIYWDRKAEEIYTDCYVKLFSDQGMMQGYGMRSDDRARNAILLKPFDSFGYSQEDSTKVVIDTVNFIGPLRK